MAYQTKITGQKKHNLKKNLSAYIEISSKTGKNVEKAFEVITEILIERFS